MYPPIHINLLEIQYEGKISALTHRAKYVAIYRVRNSFELVVRFCFLRGAVGRKCSLWFRCRGVKQGERERGEKKGRHIHTHV